MIADRQHRLLTREDLGDAGVTGDRIKHWIRTSRLRRVYRGVYAFDQAELNPYGLMLAAVLACGPAAALSSLSAAVLWNLLPRHEGPIHVTTTGPHRRGPQGVHLHRAKHLDATVHHGIPVTTPHQTLLDLAAHASDRDLARAVNEAQVQSLVHPQALLQSAVRTAGARRLRELLTDDQGFTRSEAERRLLALIRQAGLPRPRTNVRIHGHEVDAYWPDQRLVLEVDGYAAHHTRAAFERDRRRDQELQAAGLRTARTTWRQITREPIALTARLAIALNSAA